MGSSFNPSFILAVTCVCLAGAAYNKYLYSLVTKFGTVLVFSGYCIAWGGAASLLFQECFWPFCALTFTGLNIFM